MSIELSNDIKKKLSEVSDVLNLDEDDIVNRAVVLYLDNIEKYLELKREMKDWDALSDEALENFERKL